MLGIEEGMKKNNLQFVIILQLFDDWKPLRITHLFHSSLSIPIPIPLINQS